MYTRTYTHTYTHARTHARTHTRTHAHTHTHTHTHTHKHPNPPCDGVGGWTLPRRRSLPPPTMVSLPPRGLQRATSCPNRARSRTVAHYRRDPSHKYAIATNAPLGCYAQLHINITTCLHPRRASPGAGSCEHSGSALYRVGWANILYTRKPIMHVCQHVRGCGPAP
jgi:hypothetical protein